LRGVSRPPTPCAVRSTAAARRGARVCGISNFFGLRRPGNPRAFNLRGRIRTDDDGRYRFESIVPGRYPLFWPLTRPRHIHVIVMHPQCTTLTTQIYFEGDEYNERDPWWERSLTIRLEADVDESSQTRLQRGVFDITLRPLNPA
jgi:catechol 1,2-dioxygenase